MDRDFSEWLLQELKTRNWSQSELAKKEGKKIDMPPVRQVNVTFKRATRTKDKGNQKPLL